MVSFELESTLSDVVRSTPALEWFVALVDDADLGDLLDEPGVTVFAPTDDAISAFARTEAGRSVLSDPVLLRETLLYHALAGPLTTEEVFDVTPESLRVEMLEGNDLCVFVNRKTHDVQVNDAFIVQEDLVAPDGSILHVIDRVLQPAGPGRCCVTDTDDCIGCHIRGIC